MNANKPGPKRTVVEEGTVFRGTLTAQHALLVLGALEGEISGSALEVSETGSVTGQIKVETLTCRGELGGTVDAKDAELRGRVRDATVLRASTLSVALAASEAHGSAAFGSCELEIGEAPEKAAAIAAALERRQAPAEVEARAPATKMGGTPEVGRAESGASHEPGRERHGPEPATPPRRRPEGSSAS